MVHRGHPEGNSGTYNQSVDKRIIDKVYNLVARGIARPDEVKRCIDEYVERELLPNIPAAVRPRKSNGKYYPTWRDLRNQEAFLAMFQRVAYSRSKKQFEEALMTLRNPNVYCDNVKVRDYVKKIWMPCVKCWAHVYWNQEAVNIVNTNNGVEAQNKYFKDNYLPDLSTNQSMPLLLCLSSIFFQIYTNTTSKLTSSRAIYTGDTAMTSWTICTTDQAISLNTAWRVGSLLVPSVKVTWSVLTLLKANLKSRAPPNPSCITLSTFKFHAVRVKPGLKVVFLASIFFAVFNAFDEFSYNTLPE